MLDVIVTIGGVCQFRGCSETGRILWDIPMESFVTDIDLGDQLSFVFVKNFERVWNATREEEHDTHIDPVPLALS